jgi:hypothetical protein
MMTLNFTQGVVVFICPVLKPVFSDLLFHLIFFLVVVRFFNLYSFIIPEFES